MCALSTMNSLLDRGSGLEVRELDFLCIYIFSQLTYGTAIGNFQQHCYKYTVLDIILPVISCSYIKAHVYNFLYISMLGKTLLLFSYTKFYLMNYIFLSDLAVTECIDTLETQSNFLFNIHIFLYIGPGFLLIFLTHISFPISYELTPIFVNKIIK